MDKMNATNRTSMLGELDLFDTVIGLWVPGLLAAFGIVGNVLSLWVLSRDRSQSATMTSLKALAASDFILLTGALGQQVVPLTCDWARSTGQFCARQGYLQVYAWPVVCTAQTATIWLTVLISTERYVAICAPLRAGRVGVGKVRLAIVVIGIMSIIFNVPRFFEFRPQTVLVNVVGVDGVDVLSRVELRDTDLRLNSVYRYLYNMALFVIVMYAAPLSTITALNIRLTSAVTQARRNWSALNSTQKRELRASVLPLVIVLVFAVCCTVSLLGFVLDAVAAAAVDDYPRWLQQFVAIVNVLVIFNSAINFVLMLCFGAKFRRMLRQAITECCCGCCCCSCRCCRDDDNVTASVRSSRFRNIHVTLL